MGIQSSWATSSVKRIVDIVVAVFVLTVTAPLVVLCALVVFASDLKSPFYVSFRNGRGGKPFRLYKLRTMVVGAADSGVDTTAAGDPRVTRIGRLLRKYKLDELPQFANVLLGDLSVVGPRPNVPREVQRYTEIELGLLTVRPGITDYASIVFSDLAEALPLHVDANLAYNQYVRPIKSRLALHYVRTASLMVDVSLIWWTLVGLCFRGRALRAVTKLLEATGADEQLVQLARRDQPLAPMAPPGSDRIVTADDLCGETGLTSRCPDLICRSSV